MAILERDVILQGMDADGSPTIDFPFTRLGNIEASAPDQTYVKDGDFVAVMDTGDANQMKKATLADVLRPITEKIDLGERIPEGADPNATNEDGTPKYPKIDLSALAKVDFNSLETFDFGSLTDAERAKLKENLDKLRDLDLDKVKESSSAFGPVNINLTTGGWVIRKEDEVDIYVQEVPVEGLNTGMNNLTINPINIVDTTARTAYETAIGCLLPNADVGTNMITVKAHTLPTTDFTMVLKGVRV